MQKNLSYFIYVYRTFCVFEKKINFDSQRVVKKVIEETRVCELKKKGTPWGKLRKNRRICLCIDREGDREGELQLNRNRMVETKSYTTNPKMHNIIESRTI